MIKINNKQAAIGRFPDGTLLLKETLCTQDKTTRIRIQWKYENNEELLALCFLTRHFQTAGYENIVLEMPYLPNARQDRVKNPQDVFTLKYFAELINNLHFREVRVFDVHSDVSLALIDRVTNVMPQRYIMTVFRQMEQETGKKPLLFYPDEGACKRYNSMIHASCCFGIKNRNWETGEINGLSVVGETEQIKDNAILIVDDICSYGGTFLYAARELARLGAGKIWLYVSHCESSVRSGMLYTCELVQRIYTTDSIFPDTDDARITVLPLETDSHKEGGFGV